MKWTSLRLRTDLRDAIEEYRSELEAQVARAPQRFPQWLKTQQGVTLANAIEFLLVQQRSHTERSRLYRKRKREGRQTERLFCQEGSKQGSVPSNPVQEASVSPATWEPVDCLD